ncbi:hypothetical protein [Nocardiopsis sp. LOL_012]|uniref:hypothetical protein n=1 Tax=Nocardiopsis sp. LOL_012 TaxID=3345409 RepID=UPI003A8C1961
MSAPEPPDVPATTHAPPSDLSHRPASVSHLRRYVSLRGPNTRMWIAAAYFSALLTAGFVAVAGSLVWHLTTADHTVGSVALWGAAAVVMAFLGPVGNVFMVRGLPQRITRQGISADSDGITVLQERKWWFPGEGTFVAWPEIRRVREVRVGERRPLYFIEFVLDTHRTDAELPNWAETADGLGLEPEEAPTQFYVQVPSAVKERILRMVEYTAPLPSIVERTPPPR